MCASSAILAFVMGLYCEFHPGQTINEFAAATVVPSAYDVIDHHERTRLSNRDRDIYLALLDDIEAQPNDALREAAAAYKRQIS